VEEESSLVDHTTEDGEEDNFDEETIIATILSISSVLSVLPSSDHSLPLITTSGQLLDPITLLDPTWIGIQAPIFPRPTTL